MIPRPTSRLRPFHFQMLALFLLGVAISVFGIRCIVAVIEEWP